MYSRLKLHRVADPLQKMDELPGVTIVKPLMGVDPYLETNLESHFTLDYPKVQWHSSKTYLTDENNEDGYYFSNVINMITKVVFVLASVMVLERELLSSFCRVRHLQQRTGNFVRRWTLLLRFSAEFNMRRISCIQGRLRRRHCSHMPGA